MSNANARRVSRDQSTAAIAHLKFALVAVMAAFIMAGCALPTRLDPVPAYETEQALPLGLANARFFPAAQPAALLKEATAAAQRQRKTLGLPPDATLPPAHLLALSGGGDDGAFGAGLLVGWSAAGNRPGFELVTGVSTGALIAPFAFLGSRYDDVLASVFSSGAFEGLAAYGPRTPAFPDELDLVIRMPVRTRSRTGLPMEQEYRDTGIALLRSDKLMRATNKGQVLLAHVIHLSSSSCAGLDDCGHGLAQQIPRRVTWRFIGTHESPGSGMPGKNC